MHSCTAKHENNHCYTIVKDKGYSFLQMNRTLLNKCPINKSIFAIFCSEIPRILCFERLAYKINASNYNVELKGLNVLTADVFSVILQNV